MLFFMLQTVAALLLFGSELNACQALNSTADEFSELQQEPYLSNIKQLTFSSMGFEKAGEAYFSPDETKIIFQAVPNGESNYQMYVMDVDTQSPHMVSTGKGACTCGFFHPQGEKIIFASSHSDPNLSDPDPTKRAKNASGKYKWELTPYMNIYQANLDGSDLEALTTGSAYHAECAYSSDGKEIVYASNEDGAMNLKVAILVRFSIHNLG